jgi:hypothetical protein
VYFMGFGASWAGFHAERTVVRIPGSPMNRAGQEVARPDQFFDSTVWPPILRHAQCFGAAWRPQLYDTD